MFGTDVALNFGFRSEGAVLMREASVGNDLDLLGARISNPNNVALMCNLSSVDSVWLGSAPGVDWGSFEADGQVSFISDRVRTGFMGQQRAIPRRAR